MSKFHQTFTRTTLC